jgi:prepilin-type N-terminal cleavage/methylation domain-containing protein
MIKFRKKTKNRAFTLVEVLAATAILAVAICGVLLVYSSCSALLVTSKASNIALDAAMQMMEDIKAHPFVDIADHYNGMKFSVNGLPNKNMGVVYVNDTNPEFLLVTISVCWKQGGRVIGEDTDLDGNLDAGEDKNGNGMIDSPVELVTRIVNR